MDKNRTILKTGLIMITVVMLISTLIASGLEVKRPVFLLQYRETNFVEDPDYNDVFALRYITDLSDHSRISAISFPEASDVSFAVTDNVRRGDLLHMWTQEAEKEIIGRYSIQTVHVEFSSKEVQRDEILLTKAEVSFDDGRTETFDLGRMYFYREKHQENSSFNVSSSSSSSTGHSSTTMEIRSDIEVLDVESPLLDETDDFIAVKLNGLDFREISELPIKKGTRLNVESFVSSPEDIISRYSTYDLRPKMTYRDTDNQIRETRIYNIFHQKQYFSLTDMLRYLKARGEI